MKISGTNIVTMNDSGLTKEVMLGHRLVKIHINTTKNGLMITAEDCKIVKNGDVLEVIASCIKPHECQELILEDVTYG